MARKKCWIEILPQILRCVAEHWTTYKATHIQGPYFIFSVPVNVDTRLKDCAMLLQDAVVVYCFFLD